MFLNRYRDRTKKKGFKKKRKKMRHRKIFERASGSVELTAPDATTKACLACSLGGGNAARRRVWRVVGVGVGLPRHDGEVEGVVSEDNAFLVVGARGRARYAQGHIPERRCCHRRGCPMYVSGLAAAT